MVRADIFIVDGLGKRIVVKRIWADPATRLPVRVWQKLDLAARQAENREAITGDYEFPATGPSRLEDLGVPANLPIVDEDRPTPQDPQQIIAAGEAAKARFPAHYRVIRYSAKDTGNIRIYWSSGHRFRMDNYSNIDPGTRYFKERGYDKYHLDLPAAAEQILTWARTQEDVHGIYVDTDGKSYTRHNPHPAVSGRPTQPEARVNRFNGPPMLVNSPNWPHNQPWPYANTRGPWEILQSSDDLQAGCIGLRHEAGDIRRDCIIDPAHDYICVNYIWWKQVDGQWHKDRQTNCSTCSSCRPGSGIPNSGRSSAGRWRRPPSHTIYSTG